MGFFVLPLQWSEKTSSWRRAICITACFVFLISSGTQTLRIGSSVTFTCCDQAVVAQGEEALLPMWLMQACQTWKVKCSMGFFFLRRLGLSTCGAVRACLLDSFFTFFGNGCGTATVCWELGKGSCCQILHGENSVSPLLLLAQRIWQRICKAMNHKEHILDCQTIIVHLLKSGDPNPYFCLLKTLHTFHQNSSSTRIFFRNCGEWGGADTLSKF